MPIYSNFYQTLTTACPIVELRGYAAACGRACLVALENKITGRYEHKFRKRNVWSIGPVAQEKQI